MALVDRIAGNHKMLFAFWKKRPLENLKNSRVSMVYTIKTVGFLEHSDITSGHNSHGFAILCEVALSFIFAPLE